MRERGDALEQNWLSCAKRLQAIASTGLHFCKDEYDRERYREVAEIAETMLAEIGSTPIERIRGLVSDFAQGYATPKVDVRGAVFEGESILLVRERSDGLWTLPGGFADVGFSAAENVEREVFEEAGLRVEATRLYAVRHKAKGPYRPDARDFYKLFFLCDRVGDGRPSAGHEASAARFFARDRIPRLSEGRVVAGDIETAFAFKDGARQAAVFD